MAKKRIVNKKEASLPAGIGIGLAVSIVITLLTAGVLAYLISNETLQESAIGAGALIIQLISAAGGGITAYSLIKRQRVLVCGILALCYFLVLLGMTALIFGGQYRGVGSAILAVLGGGILAVLPGIIAGSKTRKGPKRKAFR